MIFENSFITVRCDSWEFAADSAEVSYENKVNTIPIYGGGSDRRIIATDKVITLKGRYVRAEKSAYFHSMLSYYLGRGAARLEIGTEVFTRLYLRKGALTETEGDPFGTFEIVLSSGVG